MQEAAQFCYIASTMGRFRVKGQEFARARAPAAARALIGPRR